LIRVAHRLLVSAASRPGSVNSSFGEGGIRMEWLDPWWSTAEQTECFHETFAAQLELEICADDPIYRIPVRIIGRGLGDDAVFQLLDGTGRVAFVHFHWGKLPGSVDDEFRTRSTVYASLEAFFQQHIVPEHKECMADREG
jgi:hypothetical protein